MKGKSEKQEEKSVKAEIDQVIEEIKKDEIKTKEKTERVKKSLPKKLFLAIDKMYDKSQNKSILKKLAKKHLFNIEKDIVYSEAKPDVCKLDIYYEGSLAEKRPIFLYIHGGGFVAGGRFYRRGIAEWIAAQGYLVVTISYSLAPERRHFEAIKDLSEIAKWINNNADKYNYDLDRLVIGGDSAGGYYSTMLACMATNKELEAKTGLPVDLKINGLALICGIYDLELALSKKMAFDMANKLMKDYIGYSVADMNKYKHADILSPINFITDKFPMSFISYAKKDFFCGGQGENISAKLKNLGVKVVNTNSTLFKDNHCYSLMWKGKATKIHNALLTDYLRSIKEDVTKPSVEKVEPVAKVEEVVKEEPIKEEKPKATPKTKKTTKPAEETAKVE